MKKLHIALPLSLALVACPTPDSENPDPEDCCDPYLLMGEWTAQIQEPIVDGLLGPACPVDGAEKNGLYGILAVEADDTFRFEFVDLGVEENSWQENFHLQLANCVPPTSSSGSDYAGEAGTLEVDTRCLADGSEYVIGLFGHHAGDDLDRLEHTEISVHVMGTDEESCWMEWTLEVERSAP